MVLKRITALLLITLILSSCATGKTATKAAPEEVSATAQAQVDTGFSLPDVTEEPKAKEDKKGKPVTAQPDMDSVFIEDGGQQQYIILNFDNTDIETILATFGELLGINYILTPGVTGSVTIQSYSRVPTSNLFNIFQSILEINGLAAVKDGGFYRIIPIETAKTMPMEVTDKMPETYELDSAFVTQLISLENVKASEVSIILRELTPRGASLIVYEPANLLIVTALPPTLEKFSKIIDALDVDSIDSGSIRTFVYYVENGSAENLESILKTVYVNQGAVQEAQKQTTNSRVPSPVPQNTSELPGDLGDVTISAYKDINALLIKCSPRSYVSLLKVLKNIDVPPRQVLIDVMIAEVTLGSETSMGLEWMLKLNSGNIVGLNPVRFLSDTGTIVSPGEAAGKAAAGEFSAVSSGTMGNDSYIALFSALSQDNDINVLASPNILAMDNKEAEIQIGSEIPIATSTTASTEGITTTAQIQYKTVGTILTVTPHITEKGNVSMKLVVESSGVGVNTKIGTGEYPSFTTRKTTTDALVKDGHTLFIGGLISNQKTSTKSGIPLLSKIPILGYFFGSQKWSDTKTEMFVMVTPHVVSSTEEADRLTGKYTHKVSDITSKVLKIKKKKQKKETTVEVTIKDSSAEKPATMAEETPEMEPEATVEKPKEATANTAVQPTNPNLPPTPYIPE